MNIYRLFVIATGCVGVSGIFLVLCTHLNSKDGSNFKLYNHLSNHLQVWDFVNINGDGADDYEFASLGGAANVDEEVDLDLDLGTNTYLDTNSPNDDKDEHQIGVNVSDSDNYHYQNHTSTSSTSLRRNLKLSVNVEHYSSSPSSYGVTVTWSPCNKRRSYNVCRKPTVGIVSNPCWYKKYDMNANEHDCFANINDVDCGEEYKFKVSRTWINYGTQVFTIKPCA